MANGLSHSQFAIRYSLFTIRNSFSPFLICRMRSSLAQARKPRCLPRAGVPVECDGPLSGGGSIVPSVEPDDFSGPSIPGVNRTVPAHSLAGSPEAITAGTARGYTRWRRRATRKPPLAAAGMTTTCLGGAINRLVFASGRMVWESALLLAAENSGACPVSSL